MKEEKKNNKSENLKKNELNNIISSKNSKITIQKTRLCKQYIYTKKCSFASTCKFAHSIKELSVPYMPNIWVSYFNHKKSQNRQEKSEIDKILNNKGQTKLHKQVEQNNSQKAIYLLNKGADPFKKDWRGIDSLFIAIANNNQKIVNRILQAGQIYLDQKLFTRQTTYLLEATNNSNYHIMKMLLEAKANPDLKNSKGKTALITSLLKKDHKALLILLQFEANVKVADNNNKLPLQYAIEQNLQKQIYILYKRCNYSRQINMKVLELALIKNDLKLIDIIIKRQSGWMQFQDKDRNSFLMILFKNGFIDSMLYFIQKYPIKQFLARPNKNQQLLILQCMKIKQTRLAKYLIRKIIQVQYLTYQKRIMLMAAQLGQYQILDMLLKLPRTNPNKYDQKGRSPLILAVINDHLLTVDSILKSKKQINVRWKDHQDISARRYCKNKKILTMLNQYMIQTHQQSQSLLVQLQQQQNRLPVDQ